VPRSGTGRFASEWHPEEPLASDDGYGFGAGPCGCGQNHEPADHIDPGEVVEPGGPAGPVEPADSGADEGGEGRKPIVTRRRFIQGLAIAGTVGFGVVRNAKPVEQQGVESQVAGQAASTRSVGPDSHLQVASPGIDANLDALGSNGPGFMVSPAPVDQRVLVLIEFQGGNDGLSTIVPYGSSSYYDLRPGLAIDGAEVLPIDNEIGVAPALARLHQRQLGVVEGVGPVDGVLSHFEMVERWDLGDMLGKGGQRAGYLARLADAVDVGGAVTGLSVAGDTPRLDASRSSTLSMNNLNQLRILTNDDWIFPRYRRAVRSFGGGPMSTMITDSWTKLFDVGEAMTSTIDEVDGDSLMVREGGGLGRQLAMAAEMIKADIGVRVIHASLGGFDTHEGHQGRHNQLMGQFDAAVDGFLQEIETAGMLDRVLVGTTSEFGRRVQENGSGLDHGAASTMLLVGPIRPGRHGEPSPLNDLDGNDNLKTTVPLDRYLASLAQDWLGSEAASVLPDSPQPLGLI
jgi:uncharacterized protein (DUF1501 family)